MVETLPEIPDYDNDEPVTTVSNTALPVVDLRDEPGRLQDRLRQVTHEVGVFYLTGHGVPAALTARVLEGARQLFALPQADKDAIAMVHSPHFRGYTRMGGELTAGEVDWREEIDIGPDLAPAGGPGEPDYLRLQGPNQWPASLPELSGIIAEWDAALTAVARTLLRHWAVSLGSPPDVFDSAFDGGTPATIIKVVRYPASGTRTQGVGPHKDGGVLTLLLVEPGSWGLQVREGRGAHRSGGWIDVPALDGAFIVNIGELLEVASGGYLQATEHRVNLSHTTERISVPFIFNPRLDAQLPVLSLPPELAAHAGRHPDPSNPIFSVYGRNAWKSRLRSHPDVAAAHGYSPGAVGAALGG